eukprot:Rhum_TRINITY_DN11912_c0_g2::Rhum_TRINITY_DN11912_c0_g2_i2::g.47873::m.47873/K15281/SLC35D; solute carrier family 35
MKGSAENDGGASVTNDGGLTPRRGSPLPSPLDSRFSLSTETVPTCLSPATLESPQQSAFDVADYEERVKLSVRSPGAAATATLDIPASPPKAAAAAAAWEVTFTQSIGIVVLFIALATWATVSNKMIMRSVLVSSNLLLFIQGVGTVFVLQVAARVGLLSADVVSLEAARNKNKVIIAVSYAANVAFGLACLNYVSIPMFGALKRLTVAACWVGEVFLFPGPSTYAVVPALALILLGAVVAGWNDLEFHLIGYCFGLLSCLGQGLSLVLSKTLSDPSPSSKGKPKDNSMQTALEKVLSVVHLNAVVSSLTMGAVLTFTDGWGVRCWREEHLGKASPWADYCALLVNVLSIILLNIAIFLDCTLNTPLTHAVAGNFKGGITTVAGLIVFQTPLKPLGAGGLLLSFGGGAYYSYVKYEKQKAAQEALKAKGSNDSV